MNTPKKITLLLLGVTLATSSCTHYSTVTEKRPKLKAVTPQGRMIVDAMKHPAKDPAVQIGRYIDAAHSAGQILATDPTNAQAKKDYNFAVGRLFEVIHEAKVQPWKKPLICPGAEGDWEFSVAHDGKPEHDPSHFRILPADRFTFRGKLVKDRAVKEGLGAPMVIASVGFDPTKFDPFIQGKNVYYGVTEVLQFNGRKCVAAYMDPLATETVNFGGHTFPVAADFTAPIGLALAELKPRKIEIERMFRPDKFVASARLARLQPYDPRKIPILCIHGLGDSQATWAPMIEALRSDPVIRQNYQIWFFSYPTGYPYPLMAELLRKKMDAINSYYPGHKPIVVLGHSMGAMIAREFLIDSGMAIWNKYFDQPPDKLPLAPETRAALIGAFIFKPRPEVSRIIFMSGSHRGADMATGFIGRLGAKLIGNASNALGDSGQEMEAVSLAKADPSTGSPLTRLPNSIDALRPGNRFVTTIDELPMRGAPYHSIIGDRGKGGNLDRTPPVSTDGIVPYWSSHLDGAASELVIPSGHWSNQHPMGIAEVKRILKLHIGKQ